MAGAHHPDREHHPIWPRIDVIPPLGIQSADGVSPAIQPPDESRWLDRLSHRPQQPGGDGAGTMRFTKTPTRSIVAVWKNTSFITKPWEGLKIGPRISVYQPKRVASKNKWADATCRKH